jgi:hypothetical protein
MRARKWFPSMKPIFQFLKSRIEWEVIIELIEILEESCSMKAHGVLVGLLRHSDCNIKGASIKGSCHMW